MNKTVTINISGIIFHIEEDAYDKLSKYLVTIRSYFVNAQDKDEIMSDIEARIAELLKEKVSDYKQVVLMADVDHVMNIMGKPEDFVDPESQNESSSGTMNYSSGRRRRVFRDPDAKVVGGVCAGMANYFGIDPLWIRIAIVALVFMSFGFLIPFYIILWMIIPEARTTAEKLEMHGEPIDINNISKTVQEEAQQAKERIQKFGRDFQHNRAGDRFLDFIRQMLSVALKVFVKLAGLFLLFIGIMFMVAVIAIILNKATIDGTDAQLYINDFMGTNRLMVFMGILLILGIPAIMLMYKGFKMLFNIRFHNKWLNITSGVLWTLGFIIIVFAAANISKEFESQAKIKTAYNLQGSKMDTLYLAANLNSKLLEDFDSDEIDYHRGNVRVLGFRNNSFQEIESNGEKMIYGSVRVKVLESLSDSFEVNIIKSAYGTARKEAQERAKQISYSVVQTDSLLMIEPLYMIEKGVKLRGQELTVEVRVPKGKVIMLDKSLFSFIHDVDNVTNTWDGDMVGRRWKMTQKGLECIDCDGLDMSEMSAFPEPPQPPMPPGIHIDDKDAKVHMDGKGINIKSEEATIDISDKGIKIETKDVKEKK